MHLGIDPVERRPHIVLFALPAIMLAFAHARAAEIETQNGKTESAQRFHGVVHNLVVHGAAE
jgi:hypothetical protein